MLDERYYTSVLCLVIIGYFFLIFFVFIMIIVAIVLRIEMQQNLARQAQHRRFDDEFETLEGVIYNEELRLRNRYCPICLVKYNGGDILKVMPGCVHAFHNQCIRQWF